MRNCVDIFVNSVYVYDDKIVFTYNYKDGSQTLTLQEIESALCSDLTSFSPPEKNGNRDTITVLFSYIRLRRVILLRSDIRLTPSDIRFASLGGEYNITADRSGAISLSLATISR